MKHFTITTKEQAEALRPYNVTPQDPIKVGDTITPSANKAYHTCWDEYPEDEAITFEECMSIVLDEVTEDVLRELGGDDFWSNKSYIGFPITDKLDMSILKGTSDVVLDVYWENDHREIEIPNPTATKLRLLVAILRGE